MEIKLEKLSMPKDLLFLEEIIETRFRESSRFEISMEKIESLNLICLNALMRLYMKYKRLGKHIYYTKCRASKLKSIVAKTGMTNVFSTQ